MSADIGEKFDVRIKSALPIIATRPLTSSYVSEILRQRGASTGPTALAENVTRAHVRLRRVDNGKIVALDLHRYAADPSRHAAPMRFLPSHRDTNRTPSAQGD
jgi:hypothetical protein